jgi:hypothetical protein
MVLIKIKFWCAPLAIRTPLTGGKAGCAVNDPNGLNG